MPSGHHARASVHAAPTRCTRLLSVQSGLHLQNFPPFSFVLQSPLDGHLLRRLDLLLPEAAVEDAVASQLSRDGVSLGKHQEDH